MKPEPKLSPRENQSKCKKILASKMKSQLKTKSPDVVNKTKGSSVLRNITSSTKPLYSNTVKPPYKLRSFNKRVTLSAESLDIEQNYVRELKDRPKVFVSKCSPTKEEEKTPQPAKMVLRGKVKSPINKSSMGKNVSKIKIEDLEKKT